MLSDLTMSSYMFVVRACDVKIDPMIAYKRQIIRRFLCESIKKAYLCRR